MKNQYFGDIHDFKKYTLLKWFMEGCDDRLRHIQNFVSGIL